MGTAHRWTTASGTVKNHWDGTTSTTEYKTSDEIRYDSGKEYWLSFNMVKRHFDGAIVNGVYQWDGYPPGKEIINYPSAIHSMWEVTPWDCGIEVPDWPLLVAKLASVTNPSKPKYSIAQFALEMKDLPEMFHIKGKSIIKRAANGFVNYHFALKTLISDFQGIWNMQHSYTQRLRSLQNLRNTKSTVEKATLFEGTGSKVTSKDYQIALTPELQSNLYRQGHLKIWGAVKYSLGADYYGIESKSDSDLDKLVRESMYGLYEPIRGGFLPNWISVSDIWEALPWSWLADYFSNIGDVAGATDNRLGLTIDKSCIMSHFKARIWHLGAKIYDPWGWRASVTPGGLDYESKSRSAVDLYRPYLAVKPLLSDHQLNIIAALLVSAKTR